MHRLPSNILIVLQILIVSMNQQQVRWTVFFFLSFFYTWAQQEMGFEVSNEMVHILFSQQCFGT